MPTSGLQERFQTLVDEHRKILYKICHSYCRDPDSREDLAQENPRSALAVVLEV
jgi:DNA-directed RNA polymerase specialized sigma24 family protein